LSAANEVAVDAFLAGRLAWSQIAEVVESVMQRHDGGPAHSVESIIDADRSARSAATVRVAEVLR
jgi:1-deoxy-D-xylulose-5-phosphate reductoisomerase